MSIYAANSGKANAFLDKVNMKEKALVFNGLFRYMGYSKYFKQKESELLDINAGNLARRYFNKLVCWKLQSQFDKETTRVIHRKSCERILLMWRGALHEAIEEGPERHLANELFAKHMFKKFRRACLQDKDKRRFKI